MDVSVAVTCSPVAGSNFALGTTTVTCNAHDTAGNNATPTTFAVGVTQASTSQPPVDTGTAPVISAENFGSVTDTSLTISWFTDHPATSRVVWGTTSVSDAAATTAGTPNYGYPNSTAEDATLGTSHGVVISGLTANTTYYFRAVSHGSPETFGPEISVTTTNNGSTPAPQPSNDTGNGGGGGGGGGGIVGGGIYSIGYVNTNPSAPSAPGSVLGASTNCFIYTQTLTVGSTGAQVTALQTRLTMEGLFSANTTGYFGSITRASVMAYQAKVGLPTVGIVGPLTRASLNAGCVAGPSAGEGAQVLGASTSLFTLNLKQGSTGAEVTALQQVLINLGFLKIVTPTGYFGPATKAALMEYQTSRGIEATGNTGPKTRAALNSNAGAVSSEK
jgi:peptidoglycan hydrolase-like protein with peptidoglycan-binding domain